jgi:hypothetical protein
MEPCSPYVPSHVLHADLMLGWFFDPEDGGDTFLWNVGSHADYTSPYPKRRQHSIINLRLFSSRLYNAACIVDCKAYSGWMAVNNEVEGLVKLKKKINFIWFRTRYIPADSIVP